MREVRKFGQRTSVLSDNKPKRKYFLVFEGDKTEPIYFNALINNRTQIGINPIIELIPLERCFAERGWSNPAQLTKRIEKEVEESGGKKLSYESLIIYLHQYIIDTHKTSCNKSVLLKELKSICKNNMNVELSDEVDFLEQRTSQLLSQLSVVITDSQKIIENIEKIVKNSQLSYTPGYDTICIIVDRDKESFVVNQHKNQYRDVLTICKNKSFRFCITNPCFEFWLLLHFADCDKLDNSLLLNNPYVSSQRKYTEIELRKRIPHFSKSRYETSDLMKRIDDAMSNEKKYCEDIALLESTVGSNIGLLIEELKT